MRGGSKCQVVVVSLSEPPNEFGPGMRHVLQVIRAQACTQRGRTTGSLLHSPRVKNLAVGVKPDLALHGIDHGDYVQRSIATVVASRDRK